MKKYFFLPLFVCLSVLAKAQKPGAVIDVLHYDFSLRLSDSSDNISGIAVIEVAMLKESNSITLDLISKKPSGKGMMVMGVKEKDQSLTFNHADDLLTINFPASARAGDKKTLTILYEGIPADGLIITNNKYKNRGFFADNWPNRARNWLPCVDHPADKAKVDFKITAPAHYQVVANGVQVEETNIDKNTKFTHYREEVPLSTKIMVIGVAAFAVQLAGEVEGIPIYSWVYPEDRDKGFYDYAVAVEILPWFIKNWGPYAYKKLANVQSKTIFGGLENANTIFYSESSVTGQRRSAHTVVHEIAHQWFGDMATETDWPHLWLSEGFATYMTIMYVEEKEGESAARKMLSDDRAQVIAFAKRSPRPVVDTSVKDYMQLLNANSYQKGGLILHMLRQQVGDDAFRRGIRTYYEKYAGKNASTDDFRAVMEAVAKQDLKQFFKQWLFTPGHPVLDVQWKYDAGNKSVEITVVQKQDVLFEFPLELGIVSGGKMDVKTVQVKHREVKATFKVAGNVEKVETDSGVKLLWEEAGK